MKLGAVKKLNLDISSWWSVVKGAGIAAIGAGLTYLTSNLSGMDFGSATPMIVAGLSIFANYVRKLIFPNENVNTNENA